MAYQLTALPHGCSRSKVKVIPKNWKTQKASVKREWRIYYRFYDPALKGTKLWGKLIPVKGMNRYGVLEERQAVTAGLLSNEESKLAQGYNPITKRYNNNQEAGRVQVISPATPFLDALRLAEPKLDLVDEVHKDIQSIIVKLEEAGEKLFDTILHKPFNELLINQVETRHIIYLFEQCRKDNPKFSAKRENRYKANLSMCFNQLKELGVIQSNPTENIKKKKVVVEKRAILTNEEAKLVDEVLFKKDYYFWRYMQIFFHSGSRNNEMLQVRKCHKVDLRRQEFTITVRKGGDYKEDIRPISNDVLHLWKEIWGEAEDGQYLFGRAFKPGPKPSHEDWPSRKWKELVKDPVEMGGLGIPKDWYALKHRRSDMLAEKLSLQHAQLADGHTTEATTRIYAVNEEERRKARQMQEIKNTQLSFSEG